MSSRLLTCKSFSSLPEDFDSISEVYVPTFLPNGCVKGRLQQRFENMCQLRKEVMRVVSVRQSSLSLSQQLWDRISWSQSNQ